MTTPDQCVDPAIEVVNVFAATLGHAFNPDGECPPEGGGSTTVRVLAGDENAIAYWDPNSRSRACDTPFLWVRLARRYRSSAASFPAAVVANRNCRAADTFNAVEVEIGVARCVTKHAQPRWSDIEDEAAVSISDSWRIQTALRTGACRLQSSRDRAVATDSVLPSGPEGGEILWTGVAYVQI